jgi:hypothetical protein
VLAVGVVVGPGDDDVVCGWERTIGQAGGGHPVI